VIIFKGINFYGDRDRKREREREGGREGEWGEEYVERLLTWKGSGRRPCCRFVDTSHSRSLLHCFFNQNHQLRMAWTVLYLYPSLSSPSLSLFPCSFYFYASGVLKFYKICMKIHFWSFPDSGILDWLQFQLGANERFWIARVRSLKTLNLLSDIPLSNESKMKKEKTFSIKNSSWKQWKNP